MLLGHVSSGRFSGSPGRSKILSRFFTSSIKSLAALESSSKSLRMMSLRDSLSGTEDLWLSVGWLVALPSNDERLLGTVEGAADVGKALAWGSTSAAANISADAMTLRSEEV